jgi:hypothetical protein
MVSTPVKSLAMLTRIAHPGPDVTLEAISKYTNF